MVYTRNANDGLSLESASFGGGRFSVSESGSGREYTPNYILTDHLGSTRIVCTVDADSVRVVERNDYFPYGMKWEHPDAQLSDNRYLYNGKELQTVGLPDATQYLDYGARILSPRLGGRWLSMDPLSEDYKPSSPYAHVLGNPIKLLDPNGMEVFYMDDGRYVGKVGENQKIRVIRPDYNYDAARAFYYKGDYKALMYISQAFEEFVEDVEDVTSDAPLMLWADNRRNCYNAAAAQLKLAGVDLYDAYSAIDTYTETGQNENRIGGIILLVSQLKQGQPVMVGVAQTTKEGQFVKVLNSDGKTPSNRILLHLILYLCALQRLMSKTILSLSITWITALQEAAKARRTILHYRQTVC